MKRPFRRFQFALLCAVLTLFGFTISAQWMGKLVPAGLNEKMQLLRRTPGNGNPATAKPPAAFASGSATTLEPAQSGGNFNLTQAVVPGGGGSSTGGNNGLTGALGQSVAGASSGGNFALSGGFFGGAVGGGCPTITVSPPVINTGTAGTSFSQTFTQTGSGSVTFSTANTLPAGITLAANGTLAGTPTQTGTFPLTVTVTDAGNCTGSANYTLTINCQTITVIAPATNTGTVGSFFSQNFTQSGGLGTVNFTLNSGTPPAGVTLAANGTLAGTPTQSGSFPLTVKATDANGCLGISATYTLIIQSVVNCPSVTGIAPAGGAVGATVTVTGTNFTGVTAVKFSNNVTASFSVNSNTQITATVPAGAVTGPLTISKPGCSEVQTPVFTVGSCLAVSISTALSSSPGSSLTVPVMVADLTGRGVTSYDFTLMFDPSLVTLQSPAFDTAGTLSNGMAITPNTATPGKLTISAFGIVPLAGAGTLLNLKFNVVGAPGACTDLMWTSFRFNEGTPCAVPANGRVCVQPDGTISGTISYCLANTTKVAGVVVSTDGPSPITNTTTSTGFYLLSGLSGGAVTVTPAKTGGVNGISSFDASLVAQAAAGLITMTGCQVTAGDASNNGGLSSFDASLIAQYAAGLPNAGSVAGTWKFAPANRFYASVNSNLTNQNFDAVLVGDVSGNWTPPGGNFPNQPLVQVPISLPTLTGASGATLTIPITIGSLSGLNITAYDFVVTFNQLVLQLQNPPVDAAGTLSSGLTITPNTTTPGRLQVAAFGISPLSGAGTLLNLKFTVVGAAGSATALTWQSFLLNEDTQTMLTNGNFSVPGCPTVTVNPATLPNAQQGTNYNQPLSATPAGTYTFAVTNGTPPTGITLTNGVLGGTPTVSGNFTFTVTATNTADNCTGSRQYTLTVCPQVTITPNTLPNGTVGTAYTLQAFTATPAPPSGTLTWSTAGNLPSGLNVSAAGVLSGTPTTAGSFTFTVTATGTTAPMCAASKQYTVTINPACGSTTVNMQPNNQTVCAGTQASFSVTATGTGTLTYQWRQNGGNIANATNSTFTIAATTTNDAGNYDVVVTSTCGSATSNAATLTINVAPGITTQPTNQAVCPNGPAVFTAAATAAPSATVQWQVSTDGGANFSNVGGATSTTLTLTNVAAALHNNRYRAVFTNTCGSANSAAATLLVHSFSIAPPTQNFPGGGGNGNVTVTVGGPCSWTALSNAPWLTINSGTSGSGNGTVNYTVAPNSGAQRTGTITAAGQTHTVTQDANNGNGLVFYPLPRPLRLLDTRANQGPCDSIGTPITGGTSITTQARVTCDGITIPNTARAIVGNVTAINQTASFGFLTLFPAGQSLPLAANLIYEPGQLLSNNFTVGLNANGEFSIFAERTLHTVIDVSGYFAPPTPTGLFYHALPRPLRLLDTRPDQSLCDNVGAPITSGTALTTQARISCNGLTIPTAAQAIVGNATVINQTASFGFMTLFPSGQQLPLAANMIYAPNQLLSNYFTVGLSAGGAFDTFAERTLHLVIDVAGYYSTEANDANGPGLLFNPLPQPLRLLDTRPDQSLCDNVGVPITGGTSLTTQARITCNGITIPASAQAVNGNVTVINQTAQFGFMTLFPAGQQLPLAANMIYAPGQLLSNAFVVGLSGIGEFNIFGERTIHVVVDVSGYFAP